MRISLSEAEVGATACVWSSGAKRGAPSSGEGRERSCGGERGWASRGATRQDHAPGAASLQRHFPVFPTHDPAGLLWFRQRRYPEQGVAATGTMQEPT